MSKKVAIVGYSMNRNKAPFNDESFEIWGLNDLYKHIPRYDRWFQLHTANEVERRHFESVESRDNWETHLECLKQMTCPVYLQEYHPEIPHSIKYPLEDILAHFGRCFVEPDHAAYFTNSVSYMIALAIYEGFEELHIYGVDMATSFIDNEYSHQRPSCEFWLGMAAGRGMKLHIPKETDLLKTRFLYGYEDEKKHTFETKIQTLQSDIAKKKAQAITQQRQWRDYQKEYEGAELALKEIMVTWQ